MQGTKAEPGVIPRVVRVSCIANTRHLQTLNLSQQALFEKKGAIKHLQTSLSISYMEIYKDDVYDLLVTRENVSISFLYLTAY